MFRHSGGYTRWCRAGAEAEVQLRGDAEVLMCSRAGAKYMPRGAELQSRCGIGAEQVQCAVQMQM